MPSMPDPVRLQCYISPTAFEINESLSGVSVVGGQDHTAYVLCSSRHPFSGSK